MFNLFKNKKSDKILIIGKEVQSKVDIELKNLSENPIEGSPLLQLGIKDGFEIINEFNSVGEYGLAFEHILYMIDASDVQLSKKTKDYIYFLSEKMNISIESIQRQMNK